MVDSPQAPIGDELDLRSLRYFVIVAEELHFTRAAARALVAQQALSRDVQRLERRLGTRLFVRSTRRVTLTPDGERLLPLARELLAAHDRLLDELGAHRRPLLVDLLTEAPRTGPELLEAARRADPGLAVRRRHSQGMAAALASLAAGEVDVALGRVDGLGRDLPATVEAVLVRLEAVGLLVPDDHPLAAQEAIPMATLAGLEVDAGLGNPHAPEWLDFVARLAARSGMRPLPPHAPAEGLEDEAAHLADQGVPILTTVARSPVPGGAVRRIVDPVPLYPVSLVTRRPPDPRSAALLDVARRLGRERGWLERDPTAWLPEPDRSRIPPRPPGRSRGSRQTRGGSRR